MAGETALKPPEKKTPPVLGQYPEPVRTAVLPPKLTQEVSADMSPPKEKKGFWNKVEERIDSAGEVIRTGVQIAGKVIKNLPGALYEEAKNNPASFIPVYGSLKDFDEATKKGELGLAGFSAVGAIVDGATLGVGGIVKKLGTTTIKVAVKEAAVVAGKEAVETGVKELTEAGVKAGVKKAVEKISITLVSETGEKAVATFTKETALAQLKEFGERALKGGLSPHEEHAYRRLIEEVKDAKWDDVLKAAGIGEAKGALAAEKKAGEVVVKETVKTKSLLERFKKGVSEVPVPREVEATAKEAAKNVGMKGEIKEIVEIDPFKAIGKQKPSYYTPSYLVRVEHEGKEFIFGFAKGGKGGITTGVVQKIEDATVQLGISAGRGGRGAVTKTAEVGGESYTFVLMKEFGGLK
ncbi:MAG: hypothetical protein QXH27_04145 [Candidatus Micrarchaeia archaeon]